MKLEGKRCVVIGASSGIGAALAKALAGKGCPVALLARREQQMETLAAEIDRVAGRKLASVYKADVTDYESAAPTLDRIAEEMGGIDVLIYNAGIMPAVADNEFSFAKDRAMIEVNLLGAMAWLGAAGQRFLAAKSGAIVGISSIAGDRGRAGNMAYITSKAGLDAYLESLRNRLGRHGVLVTTIKPGYVQTDMLAGLKRPPLPAAKPEEAAALIVQAIEDDALVRYVPGWWRWFGMMLKMVPSPIMQRLNV